MRKRTLLVLALLMFLGIGGLALWSWATAPSHRINRQTFLRVRLGMTKQEAYDLIGCPPGDYRTGPTFNTDGSIEYARDPDPAMAEAWLCDTDSVHVYFDDAGIVVGREWAELVPRDPLRKPVTFVGVGVRHWLRRCFGD